MSMLLRRYHDDPEPDSPEAEPDDLDESTSQADQEPDGSSTTSEPDDVPDPEPPTAPARPRAKATRTR